MFKNNQIRFYITMFLTVLFLVGCANDENSATNSNDQTASGKAVKGGELTYALATSPDTLDPHRTGLVVALRVITQVFDSLVTLDENNKVHPHLATEWVISED